MGLKSRLKSDLDNDSGGRFLDNEIVFGLKSRLNGIEIYSRMNLRQAAFFVL